MPILGRYEVVSELFAGKPASIFRAKLVEGKAAQFAIKLLDVEAAETEDAERAISGLIEQARVQKSVAAGPDSHWAPIYHFAKNPAGAFYVTDLYPASLQQVLRHNITPKAKDLSRLFLQIAHGLRSLRVNLQRAHGNLKPANLLLTSGRLDQAEVKLTDPATNEAASRVREAGDFLALGRLLFELVEHRPPTTEIDQSVPTTAAWRALGPTGTGWRQLCADLLAPQAQTTEGHLDELIVVLQKLRDTHRRRFPRWIPRAAAVLLIAAAAGAGIDYYAQRKLAHIRNDWAIALSQAVNQPKINPTYQNDSSLRTLLQDLATVNDPQTPASENPAQLKPLMLPRVRTALLAASRVATDVSPENWPVAGRVQAAQYTLSGLGWNQPAQFLARSLADLQPSTGAHLDSAVGRIILLDQSLSAKLPEVLKSWKDLNASCDALATMGDPYLVGFASLLRSDAAQAVQIGPGGVIGQDRVASDADLSDKILTVAKNGFPQDLDIARWVTEVTSRMDVSHLTIADAHTWLAREPEFVIHDEDTTQSTAELRALLNKNLAQVAKLDPDATEKAEIDVQRSSIESNLDAFSHRHFTSQDMSDGAFAAERSKIESQIEALLGDVRRGDPSPWIASLGPIKTHSEAINAYWEDWKHVLQNSIAEMSRRNELYKTYRQQTENLRSMLLRLDQDFPTAPANLSDAFADAAKTRREEDLTKLLQTIDLTNPNPTVSDEKSGAQAYQQWTQSLIALSHDFPLRSELLLLGDAPDQAWKSRDPAFWSQPVIQHLVAPDLARLAKLRAVTRLSRSDLVDAATESTSPEITFAAWQQLGLTSTTPAWPTQVGEIETERDLRDKLTAAIKTLHDLALRDKLTGILSSAGVDRWRRFVESASSEAMLQQAMEQKGSFGSDTALFYSLSPRSRFNLALYIGRQQARQSDPHAAQQVVDALSKSAGELPDHRPVQRLLDRLARINSHENFSDQNLGDRFTLNVPGASRPFVFQRVEPANDRPFYLCTTAVSFGQFAGVITAANVWPQTIAFNWGYQAGQNDTRKGPRVWEWVTKPSPMMINSLLWLHPEENNDYLPAFRMDRFNRTALSDAVGGNPSPDYPMQQIPAEAALYFAGLCGCRLPTSAEWRNAYAIFEKTVPPERWNLRDQTWDQQRRYAAASDATPIHFPDEGIFQPDDVSEPTGASARARPENDGTLFFRPVDAAGGGTFFHLIGNVAQFVCEAPDAFEAADKSSASAIRKFLADHPDSMAVIGGSALSPPDMPLETPIPLSHTDTGYADVGLRLAFTAPARSPSERLSWVLGGQPYLWQSSPTTAPTIPPATSP